MRHDAVAMQADALAMRRDRIVMCMMPSCYVRTASPCVATQRRLLLIRSRASPRRQAAWPIRWPARRPRRRIGESVRVRDDSARKLGTRFTQRDVSFERIRDALRVRQDNHRKGDDRGRIRDDAAENFGMLNGSAMTRPDF